VGELLNLRREHVLQDGYLTFLETKNGTPRRLPLSAAMTAVLDACPKGTTPYVFTNPRTHDCYTVNGVAHVFRRAIERVAS
jgi:integrase